MNSNNQVLFIWTQNKQELLGKTEDTYFSSDASVTMTRLRKLHINKINKHNL
jgi:hypothetical protein